MQLHCIQNHGIDNYNLCMNIRFLPVLVPLLLASVACQPMIAIGKYEFLVLITLMAVLLGPPVYKLIRRVEQFLKREKGDK